MGRLRRKIRFLVAAATIPAAAASCDMKIVYPLAGTIVPPGDVAFVLSMSKEARGESSCEQLCIQLDEGRPLCAAADDLASGTTFTGLSFGYHNLTILNGDSTRGASSWFHVSPGISEEAQGDAHKAHLAYIRKGSTESTDRIPVSVSRFDLHDLQLAEAYMRRFGLGGFAVVKPAQETNVEGKKAATLLQGVLNQELVMQELRTLRGTYLNISGFLTGTDAFHTLKLLPSIYEFILLKDAAASLRLFSALEDALRVNPSFAETAHLYLNLAWDLKMPQDAVDRAVRIARQSIEAGRSDAPPPSHLQPPRPVGGILLLTVASHSKPQLELLRRSAAAAGMDLRVDGLGDPWRGLGSKVVYVRDALKGVDDNTVVLFLDAFDTLVLPAATALVQRFLWIGADLVFGAELACAPDVGMRLLYPGHLTAANTYLNSGTYVGRASDVRRMLDEVAEDLHRNHAAFGGDILGVDDQRWFTRFFLRHAGTSRIVLDTARALFLPMHAVPQSDIVVVPGNAAALLQYGPTGGSPCVLHGNGDGKVPLNALAEELEAAGWPPRTASPAAAKV
ncbi:unnamed protein product [Phaeothamnion confervicola]